MAVVAIDHKTTLKDLPNVYHAFSCQSCGESVGLHPRWQDSDVEWCPGGGAGGILTDRRVTEMTGAY